MTLIHTRTADVTDVEQRDVLAATGSRWVAPGPDAGASKAEVAFVAFRKNTTINTAKIPNCVKSRTELDLTST
jgi:hypothetical protein